MGVPDRFNEECFAQARFSHVEKCGDGWSLGQPAWAPLTVEQGRSFDRGELDAGMGVNRA